MTSSFHFSSRFGLRIEPRVADDMLIIATGFLTRGEALSQLPPINDGDLSYDVRTANALCDCIHHHPESDFFFYGVYRNLDTDAVIVVVAFFLPGGRDFVHYVIE